ncbi:50S ribosomal protein L18 [Tichowtungia aerotolerans]|uniref:Large ribosomal subunit protein uL18 n=1 Tax=Tichowtungia aerotolerans TaxID=2697043 RepID=A0A6P1M103_9BACT|nr:50S ribosomal protein L18 [Tichowtungia aerotolerans]QHI68240.1 50S ribosomal protein L18 [Tichowtungia aerotolerans]
MKVKNTTDYRKRRHLRLRNKVHGTAERPRMAVHISNRYIYVQVIDDDAQKTLCSVSSLGGKCTVETAKELGTKAAEAAKAKEITQVVFDRGGFTFGSRMRALADSAREAGLNL